MSEADERNQPEFPAGGRRLLEMASERYERTLTGEDYWWLGVGLAACTLAELGEKPYALGRLEQLIDKAGFRGVKGDWLQRFVEELAELDAEGLLWPVFERSPDGPIEATGVEIHPGFNAEAGYYLALAHIGVALAVHRENDEAVAMLAGLIGEMVESGIQPGHQEAILAVLQPSAGGDEELIQ